MRLPIEEVILEVSDRDMPALHMPYARAFLDGRHEPNSAADIARLIRLMSYDLVRGCGSGGMDPAGIYAGCLEIVHAIQGKDQEHWEWLWGDFFFRSSPCPERKFSSVQPHFDKSVDIHPPGMADWRIHLEREKLPEQLEVALASDRPAYPEPEVAMLCASLLVLRVAQDIVSPKKVSLWFDRTPKSCVLIEFWKGA